MIPFLENYLFAHSSNHSAKYAHNYNFLKLVMMSILRCQKVDYLILYIFFLPEFSINFIFTKQIHYSQKIHFTNNYNKTPNIKIKLLYF